MVRALRFTTALALATALPSVVAAQALSEPEALVVETLSNIVDDVATMKAELEQDRCLAFALVDRYLRDRFNWRVSSQAILREHWPANNAALQARFTEAFYDHLVEKYGWLIRHVEADTIRLTGMAGDPEGAQVRINTQLTDIDGKQFLVRLQMRPYDGEWLIVDVQPESASYIRDFNDEYRFEIADVGLDGLIERLEKDAAPRRQCGQ